jgi:hypothetical protein
MSEEYMLRINGRRQELGFGAFSVVDVPVPNPTVGWLHNQNTITLEWVIGMVRRSHSHPLRVDSFPVGEGLLGLSICPGKSGETVFGASWAQDLETDIAAIRA